MATLVYGMNQSLDGFVDHTAFRPDTELFAHFIEQTRGLAGSVYGTGLYEVMRYWDDEDPEWDDSEREFAVAWRAQPKWVVSSSLESVGPNATLVTEDLETLVRRLKADVDGTIEVGGTVLAGRLTELGLIDEYRIYLHPVVTGEGPRFFTGARPPLRLVSEQRFGDVLRLAYAPA